VADVIDAELLPANLMHGKPSERVQCNTCRLFWNCPESAIFQVSGAFGENRIRCNMESQFPRLSNSRETAIITLASPYSLLVKNRIVLCGVDGIAFFNHFKIKQKENDGYKFENTSSAATNQRG
jgi:hypothetical protein